MRLILDSTTTASADGGSYYPSDPTSTTITVGNNAYINASGGTYVMYIFAHNAGGFGLTGTDNVISCGSYNDASATTVNLGYEPQWVMIKRTDTTGNWGLIHSMSGWTSDGNDRYVKPNLSDDEQATTWLKLTSTGFQTNGFGGTYIYIAIRRGPMKVPTSGTSVYATDTLGGTSPNPPGFHSGFPVDFGFYRDTTSAFDWNAQDRLRGNFRSFFNSTAAESSSAFGGDYQNGYNSSTSVLPAYRAWMFQRAPSFFDEVCFTTTDGTYSGNHNLGVVPELLIFKSRNGTGNWQVVSSYLTSAAYFLRLNSTIAEYNNTNTNYTATSTTLTIPNSGFINFSATMVAYLFATCAGVSKVGSYTGTGTTLQVNCGFTAGARFVLIKRVNTTGDWYVWDSARGIVSGNDPYLLLNSTAAEVTSTDYIDTYSAGFEISSTAPAAINASGGTFIFLAVA